MRADEFVRRLKTLITRNDDSKFVFFLGAGCSISSGIPGAAKLVRGWLPRLKEMKTGKEDNYESWAKELYSDYTEENASSFYGKVIEDLFLTSEERQREIERLTEGKDPAFGYAVLAQLITHQECGSHCNAVLTVNFDDLIADALYLYTQKKPLVISHESLAGFVRITRTRPLIIKLHGDARLEPKNTELEIKVLDEAVRTVLKNLLCEMGLIFIGYGGHDESIAEILDELPPNALPWGVYWIGSKIPGGKIGAWLELRNAVWVNHNDFDELMLLILNEFDLSHPRKDRFDRLMDTYFGTFKKLKDRIEAQLKKEEVEMLREALNKAIKEFGSWWGVVLEAEKYEKEDPEKADIIYQEGLKEFPTDADLLGSYASFLHFIRKNYDKAEEYYKKALEIDPDNAPNLGNYALFMHYVQKNYEKAEEYYKRALEIDPDNDANLRCYALFMHYVQKNYEKAEEYYKRALEIDPDNTNNLGPYANFLRYVQKNYEKAEEYYKRALELEPDNANSLGSYALFLHEIRKDYEKAEEYYKKALEIDPDNAPNLGNYALFMHYVQKNYEKAEEYYKRALEIDPDNDANLRCYALFMHYVQKNYEKAEEYYKRALEIDPDNDANLGNYALFMHYVQKNYEKAEEYYKRALEIDPDNDVNLRCYALFMHYVQKNYEKAEEYYKRALEIDPDNTNNLGPYANFLRYVQKNYEKAEEYYKRALELEPDNANSLGSYALFLHEIRKDYEKAEEYYKRALEIDPDNANNLGNYALFMHYARKNYDKAEEYYERALEIDPDSDANLRCYASFLDDIRKDYDKAEEYYRKALERDPDDAPTLGNYAGFLLGRGNEKGFSFLEKASNLARDQSHTSLLLECLFYQYAHSKDEHSQKESLKEIKSSLQEGIRSPGWDLSSNVERATKDGHPHPDFLNKLAGVISEEIDIKELDNFKLWQDA